MQTPDNPFKQALARGEPQIGLWLALDGIFVGPADLAASMGWRGQPARREVQAAIEDAIARIRRAGKAAGILTADEALARRYLELGATFVAVGVETTLLVRATGDLARRFKPAGSAAAPTGAGAAY